MIQKKKGFTLIELLVVIAIIGILSSVVLASLNSARSKGADAAVKSNLANLRAQAEIYYDTNSQYATSTTALVNCTAGVLGDTTFAAGVDAAEAAGGGSATCAVKNDAWVVSTPLKSAGNWCVDSTGRSASSTADTTNVDCN